MIPIRLTIQGLYSYQEKQTIQFNPLTRAGIFGIFGSVGSGKSTILEAITFALYGKTERLNLSGDNRNYNMMNLKSEELILEFEFKTGTPFQEYLVLVRGKRNSKKFDEVKTLERTAYLKKPEGWNPIEIDSLEQVLGLSYENFKRTIIIPQGKFQEFLQLGAKDRSQMMKELFHLQKFELSPQVAILESKNDALLNQIIGMIQGIGEVSQEQIIEKKEEFKQSSLQLSSLQSEIETLQKMNQEMNRLKELVDTLNLLIESQKNLESKKPEMDQLAFKIEEFEYCTLHFKLLINRIEEKQLRMQAFKNELQKYQSEKQDIDLQLKLIQNKLAELKPQFENQPIEKKKIEELNKIVRIKKLQSEQALLKERIAKGELTLMDLKTEKEGKTREIIKIQNNLKTLKNNRPDVAELNEVKEWYLIDNQHKKNILEIEKRIQEIQEDKKLLVLEKSKIMEHNAALNLAETETINDWVIKLQNHIVLIEKKLIEIEPVLEQLTLQTQLYNFSKQLSSGVPCPLCGSIHHPSPLNSTQSEFDTSQIKLKKIQLSEQRNLFTKNLFTLREFQLKESALVNKETETLHKLDEHTQERHKHKKGFIWGNYLSTEQLKLAFNHLTESNNQIDSAEKLIETLQNEGIQIDEKLEKYSQILDAVKKEHQGHIHETEILTNQLQTISLPDVNNLSLQQIETLILQKEQQLLHVEQHYKETVSQEVSFTKKTEQLQNFIEKRTVDIHAEQLSYDQDQMEIEQKLNESPMRTLENVQQILNDTSIHTDDKKRIEKYRQEVAILSQKIAETKHSIGDAIYVETQHLILKEELITKELQFNDKSKQTLQLENNIKRLQQELEKKILLNNQKEQLDIRAQRLKTLKQLFQGSKFVNYVSTVHLLNLCNQANERFYKLSGQKLSLELAEDNSFQVRDFLNNGKIRHVKTLSGGQTFQASLSLALALADSIHKNIGAYENFFFLDEGFGSLDKESLRLVFDSLKSLRKENRMVGIISHVEELQQEIDTYIYVSNTDEKGSIIHTDC